MITAAAKIEFPRYESYRDSGVDWLGEIPSHWELANIRSFTRLKADRGQPDLDILSVYREYGVIPKDSRDDNHNATSLDTSNYKVVEPGDLVVNKMKAWQGSMGISEHQGLVSPAYITCETRPDRIYPKFAHYLLRSKVYISTYSSLSYGVRVGQWDMHYEDFKKIPTPLPTLDEQQRIANFLDEKAAEIDEAIGKKQRLIALLKEQKAILINQWFQTTEKPILLKRFLKRIEQGWSPDCSDSSGLPSGWGVLTAGCVNGGTYYQDRYKPLPARLTPRPSIEVKKGDILMSRANGSLDLIGSAAYVHETEPGRMFSDKIFRLVPNHEMVIPELLAIALGTPDAREQIVAAVSGAGGLANNIGMGSIRNLTISIPQSLSSQNELLAKVKDLNSSQATITSSLTEQIKQLKEFKQILIAHAVTGKIKI
ncbi:restriction endonuclease subunit S [Pelagicoccus sp. SDUM812002]|uniref:restriction endonuclease subunit S n=1 Tax=Pelagicoccus sp. SDUM812002 TaxID=3041266 RepID=UPI0028100EAC|nr:restriction endonuclease subunit S [Pelagicoccus sp. SDUM812002]MDQ8184083.1 restriction endonuclease subunit S [Pelagicoccus sp. SDUM812002]